MSTAAFVCPPGAGSIYHPTMPALPRALVTPLALGGLLISCGFHTHGTEEPTGAGTSTTSTVGAGGSGVGGSMTTSSSATTGGTGGTGTTSGSGGTGGVPIVCGNGLVEPPETCDDGATTPADGCSEACAVEIGYTCSGEPSACDLIPPQVVTIGPNLGFTITDPNKGYNGDLSTMQCAVVSFADQGFHDIKLVELTVGIDHVWVGDLVLKLVSPMGTVSTMFSRPGLDDVADAYDEDNGDSSHISAGYPITFRDGAADDAETMGDTVNGTKTVCKDDSRCVYHPSPDKGPGNGFADFLGESPVGDWRVCLADGDDNDEGHLQIATLTVLAY